MGCMFYRLARCQGREISSCLIQEEIRKKSDHSDKGP